MIVPTTAYRLARARTEPAPRHGADKCADAAVSYAADEQPVKKKAARARCSRRGVRCVLDCLEQAALVERKAADDANKRGAILAELGKIGGER